MSKRMLHTVVSRNPVRRRALLLVVVLVMVVLLSLLAAGYTLMVRAHLDGVTTEIRQFKIRMAADSGMQMAINTLRYTRGDVDSWHNNPLLYRAYLVQGKEGEEAEATYQKAIDTEIKTFDPTLDEAFRFSCFTPDFDDPTKVYYGFVDESSRMDINSIKEDQLRRLLTETVPVNTDFPVDVDVLVDSFLDWREPGDDPRPSGAKSAYYATMIPPYTSKGAKFSTVEELLLVRGFTSWVVFGEDYNQNGLLDPNENDGSESFPPDDANGVLWRGIAPFFTVWSQEANISGDNRPRIFLNMEDLDKLQEKLETEIDGDIVSYIMAVRSAGIRFNSVMNLLPAPPPDEEEPTSQPDNGGEPPNDEPPPATQPAGEDPTSQPFDQKGEDSAKRFADQDGSESGSENPPPAGGPGGNPQQNPTSQPVFSNLTDEEPPGTYEDLPILLDRLTVSPSPIMSGRINVTTAPREVLGMIDELTPDNVEAIVAARQGLDSATKSSPAWLVTQGVISEYKFRRILEKITTKSSVFRIETVGFADNIGIVERYMAVIQMRGPVAQVLYYRNLNPLGMAYTPHGDEVRGPQEQSK
ncbi:MAG: general secretion pathway protein GspK [Planctomycetes bacterium]|nr:general secretion pathway protein GspK [Planctomycetota bacterium]